MKNKLKKVPVLIVVIAVLTTCCVTFAAIRVSEKMNGETEEKTVSEVNSSFIAERKSNIDSKLSESR